MMPQIGPSKPVKNLIIIVSKFAIHIIKAEQNRKALKAEILTQGTYRSDPARPMSKFHLCNFKFMIHFISLRIHSQM